MSEKIEKDPSPSGGEFVLNAKTVSKQHSTEEPEKTVGSKEKIAQKSGSVLQKEGSKIISPAVGNSEHLKDEGTEEEGLFEEEHVEDSLSGHEQPSAKSSDLERLKSVISSLESGEEKEDKLVKGEEEKTRPREPSGDEVQDLNVPKGSESELAEEGNNTTLLGSRTSGLGISRQVSPDQLHEKLLALEKGKRGLEATEEKRKQLAGEEWSDEVWLQIAARQRALRRSRKPADIALRKQKYPELFRSDVSINPSYTDYKLPYFAVARQRYLRSLRLLQEQIRGDIQEMALLQPRALNGVRIIRTFCQGAPHDTLKDTLNPKDRRRLEYLLVENIY